MTRLTYDSALRLVRKASLGGAKRRSTTEWEWDVSGDCQSPVLREFWSRPASDDPRHDDSFRKERADYVLAGLVATFVEDWTWVPYPVRRPGRARTIVVGPGHQRGPIRVDMTVRCRRCSNCMKVRSRMWYARAMNETLSAARTWFGTITLRPDVNYVSLARARRQATRRGVIWEEMTPEEQFAELHKQNGLHLQLWLKRVRKESGAPLRFLLVCEAHKSGLPHYHCLVHEVDELRPVRHKTLSDQWKLGFTNFKLCDDPKQAGYLCKYLSKSAAARVRASARYGQRPRDIGEAVNKAPTRKGRAPTHNTPLSTRSLSAVMSGGIVEHKETD